MNRRQAAFGLFVVGWDLLTVRRSSAQPAARTPIIGLLDAGERTKWWAAFREQLRDFGWVDRQNVSFEPRFAGGNFERLPALAQELVHLKVAVIVTAGRVAVQAAKAATSTIPIVMATGDDPVPLGLAATLARPGGNVTGVTSIAPETTGKRLELLKEVIPETSRLAVLWHRDNPASAVGLRELETAARASKVALQVLGVKTADEFTGAFAAMSQERAQAVVVNVGPSFFSERQRIAGLAIKHRLPSVYPSPTTWRPEGSFPTGRATPISFGAQPCTWTRS
jgi:putative ABC transport system substrate-binding protein